MDRTEHQCYGCPDTVADCHMCLRMLSCALKRVVLLMFRRKRAQPVQAQGEMKDTTAPSPRDRTEHGGRPHFDECDSVC
ncbi:hypothetical protein BS47DRAFT_985559 [Hydnum rufescens UP504]|uniref:Uncharacterized protein n=1 Tax=Hydnum rufescens UP504 TaxID=1448309 RepID=A0A9P6DTG2_9AGAM|nr:hypothetical protein BS47DRAFT_985559 [Hydnum rufescens UP504]